MLEKKNLLTQKLYYSQRLLRLIKAKYGREIKLSRHEDIWWNGDIAPRILSFGTIWC
jgi:hypothetical protein